jgi:hypothetical protein
MPLAPVFRPFCRDWRLRDQEAKQCWTALLHARSRLPSAWRQ